MLPTTEQLDTMPRADRDPAKIIGVKTFDVLPQDLFNSIRDRGFDPWGQFVFAYPPVKEASFGVLAPLTKEALDFINTTDIVYWYDHDVHFIMDGKRIRWSEYQGGNE